MKEDKNKELKLKFLEYYRQLPVIKLAAGSIGRTDDTITNWRKEDTEFSEQVDMAKSEWGLRTSKQVRSKEWLLERTMNDHFGNRLDVTSDGEKLEGLVVILPEDEHKTK